MTPKEKAQQLADDMFIEMSSFSVTDEVLETVAKQCALIAVDEILKSGCTLPNNNAYYGDNEEASKYWQEVKQELKNL